MASYGVHLERREENLDEIASLQARYGSPVGVGGVLDHLNRQATAGAGARTRPDVGLHLEPAGQRLPAVVAAGHQHLRRRLGHRGLRGPAADRHELVLQGRQGRQPRQPGHVRRRRPAELPARADRAGRHRPARPGHAGAAADPCRRRGLVRALPAPGRHPAWPLHLPRRRHHGGGAGRATPSATASCCRCGSPTPRTPRSRSRSCATRSCRSTAGRRRRSWSPASTAPRA